MTACRRAFDLTIEEPASIKVVAEGARERNLFPMKMTDFPPLFELEF